MSYETARDLPSFKDLEEKLKTFQKLSPLLPADQRNTPLEIKAEMDKLADLIDGFYKCFGDRHWIFHEMLNVNQVQDILDNNRGQDDAEQRLIAMHADPDFLRRVILKCYGIPALRKRIPLVEKARDDYLAERYYSTVFILVSVIDGFVNEFEPSHRGAHVRTGEELSAYDSAISHHKGIESVHKVFLKGMSVTKEEPITELYRHGIMHGIAINFDNIIVATKAWNMLLAFMDWATAKSKAERPQPPEIGIREAVERYRQIKKDAALIKSWRSYTVHFSDPAIQTDELFVTATQFYDAWKARNYGKMSTLLTTMTRSGRESVMPKFVKDEYSAHTLKEYRILSINHRAAAAAEIDMEIKLADNIARRAEIRWLYEDKDGEIGNSMKKDGSWRVVTWASSFYK